MNEIEKQYQTALQKCFSKGDNYKKITKFVNEEKKVFGTLFSVVGNAASQYQFFLTDSTKHFLVGSLYFYARPNYDSIYPAADYLQKDIIHLIESFKWK